jgi:mannose-6-phosphate isomerase-like protein (cupin superfamily)
MLGLLFENIKVYGRYVRTNRLDGLEYWNRIKLFISRPEQKVGMDELNKIIGNKWTIGVKLNSTKQSVNIEEIYQFVHGEDGLKIYGEEGDEESKSLEHGVWEQNHFFLQLIRIPKNSELNLIKLLQVAYNLGQLSVCLESGNFSSKAIDYFKLNNLDKLESYIGLCPEQNNQIETNIQITDLITNINSYVLEQMNLVQMGENADITPFYSENVEELTKSNNDYRRVLYTGMNQQFVLMSIPPNDGIKMETHKSHDQFIRIEQGDGEAKLGNSTYRLKDDSAFIIPAGTPHQILNTSNTEPLKLYTIYSPPEHPDKLTQSTNPDKLTQSTNPDKLTQSTNPDKLTQSTNPDKLTQSTNPDKFVKFEDNVIIDTVSDEFVSPSIIEKELREVKNELVQKGGYYNIKIKKEIDYEKKYNEYKNKYITLKKFISKYH